MNKVLLISTLAILAFSQTPFAQNVGIGTVVPDESAILDVMSSEKGLLIPRMSASARQAIVSPATGLMVFDSTNNAFYYFTGNGWLELLAGSVDKVMDADEDTRIEVEENPDEDIIKFYTAGTESVRLLQNSNGLARLEMRGSGNSTYIGVNAGDANNQDNGFNTYLGNNAGAMSNGYQNVMVGVGTGRLNVNGVNNTMVGHNAGHNSTGHANVFLGRQAGMNETGSNKLFIDNSSTTDPLIYGEFNTNLLRVNGTLNMNNSYSFPDSIGTMGQVMRITPMGTVDWLEPSAALLEDTDMDTRIQVEESPDDDVIRFDMGGTEHFVFDGPHIYVKGGTSVFLGNNAGLSDDLSYNNNIYIGESVARLNVSGESNVGIGAYALELNTQSFNTAIGYNTLKSATTSNNSTALGSTALRDNINGSGNVAVGSQALVANTNGSGNVALGTLAGQTNQGSGNIFIGHNAGKNEAGSNVLYIDNSATSDPLIFGNFQSNLLRVNGTLNINNAYSFPTSDGTSDQVLQTNGSGTLSWGNKTVDTDDQVVDTLQLNGAILELSLENDGLAKKTVDLGSINAVQAIIEDNDQDTKIQVEEIADEDIVRVDLGGTEYFTLHAGRLEFLNSGNSVFLGFESGLNDDLSDNRNAGIGHQVLKDNTTGRWNSALGYAALRGNTTGEKNVAIGFAALSPLNGIGSNNVAVGTYALQANTSGNQNVAIGANSGFNLSSGSGNVFIGYDVGKGLNSSNRLMIDNSDTTDALIYGEFDNDLVTINGSLRINDGTQQDGYVLTSDIDGNASWQMGGGGGEWTTNGSHIHNTNSGNVGIGAMSPGSKLTVYNAGGATSVQIVKDNDTQSSSLVFSGGNTTYNIGTPNEDRWRLWNSSSGEVFSVLPSGNVGFGTVNPLAKLHISGALRIQEKILANGGNGLQFATSDSITHFHLLNNGTMEAGTASDPTTITIYDTSRTSLIIKTPDNTKESGVAFRNSGNAYSWSIFREDAGSNDAHLVFAGGDSNNDPELLLERMRITKDGRVAIGTTTPATGYLLSVGGKIISEELKIRLQANWPDYVFDESYQRMSLYELKEFIEINNHLPNIPSASEVERNEGISVGEMQRLTIEKLEELTLYILDLKEEVDALRAENVSLRARIN